MASERIPASPAVLRWARETAGLDQPEAARLIGVSENVLDAWEEGTRTPTVSQLRKAASKYGRPFGVLLLPAPPKDFDVPRDFRSPTATARPWSRELRFAIRRAWLQRDVFLELREVLPDAVPPTDPVPEFTLSVPADEAGAALGAYLGATPSRAGHSSARDALNAWVAAFESKGIIVIQMRGVSTEEARGFAISDHPFPVIALNGSDTPKGKIFTLLHEAAHLGIRARGVCDLHEASRDTGGDVDVEHFCNAVAAACAMPRDLVDAAWPGGAVEVTLDRLETLSARWQLSTEAIILRLVSLRYATWADYRNLKPQIDRNVALFRDEERHKAQQSEGGPSYYRVKVRDIGRAYARTVLGAYQSGALSMSDAASALDVRLSGLDKLGEYA